MGYNCTQPIALPLFRCCILSGLLLMLSGCGLFGGQPGEHRTAEENAWVSQRLLAQHRQWRGVPYREGGQSRRGIDCSGFVQVAYRSVFGKKLPRTTEQLAEEGWEIDRESLRPGDLVFFKTGWWARHVGIYVNNGRFLHASKSRGVMLSPLSNPYWRDTYWMARRVE